MAPTKKAAANNVPAKMAPTKKAARQEPPHQEATTDYETEASGSSGSGIESPSGFDEGTPVNSTAKDPPKRAEYKYKDAEILFPCGRIVKKLRDGKYAKYIRKCECLFCQPSSINYGNVF